MGVLRPYLAVVVHFLISPSLNHQEVSLLHLCTGIHLQLPRPDREGQSFGVLPTGHSASLNGKTVEDRDVRRYWRAVLMKPDSAPPNAPRDLRDAWTRWQWPPYARGVTRGQHVEVDRQCTADQPQGLTWYFHAPNV